ncbi:MAG TPA: DNA repair protein RecO [Candidatus Binatia bacterium]|jgi:DNA repair protein RecO (recombination protein O)
MTPAIVLRAWTYGESDKIVCFLTESHGKITGIAKGAKRSRKRFANSLEPFSLVNLRFQDSRSSSLAFIHGCELIRVFKHLTASLEKISHASYLTELTDALSGERDENRALFAHLRDGLNSIEENGTSPLLVASFELKLLMLAGYQPMLERCRRCGNGWRGRMLGQWGFSLRDGGVLCQSCSAFRREISPLSFETLEAMAQLQQANETLSSQSFPAGVLRESHLALLRFIQYQIGKELKSAPFLDAFSTD